MKTTFVIACTAFVIGIAAGRSSVASNEMMAAAQTPTISITEIMKSYQQLPVESYQAI